MLDFRRLEAFSKVYELRSFSRAGEVLFLSQPTISAHIASLEKELGVQLFDRLGRSILPTAAAEILYRHAQDAFRSLETATAEIQLLQEHVSGSLLIGGSTIPAHYLLPAMLARFIKRHPDVTIQVSVGDSEAIAKDVVSGKLMVAMVGGVFNESSDLVFIPVLQDELVLIAPPGMKIPGEALTLDILETLPWVMREQGSGTRMALERGLAASGKDIRTLKASVVVESTQAVLRCVKAGVGLSVTSRLAAQEELERGELKILECPTLHMQREFYCTYLERRHMFPAVRFFIEFLKEQGAKLGASMTRN